MIAIVDTSSFLAFVRYYLPFDLNGHLYQLIENEINDNRLHVIDKVFQECSYVAGGIVTKSLKCICDKKTHINTSTIVPTHQFHTDLDTKYCDANVLRLKPLTPAQYQIAKADFLKGADCGLIVHATQSKDSGLSPIFITEESRSSNDNKYFKKIPAICDLASIKSMTLPQYLQTHLNIEMSEYLSSGTRP